MSEGQDKKKEEENILYDLLQPAEWTQDPEQPLRIVPKGFPWNLTSAAADASVGLWNIASRPFRWPSLSTTLKSIVSQRLPWQLTISPDGSLLAIFRENIVEIRRTLAKDETTSALLATFEVPPDARCRWQRIVWNDTSSLLACSFSSGHVRLYDKTGQLWVTIDECVRSLSAGVTSSTTGTSSEKDADIVLDDVISGMAFYPCQSGVDGVTQLLVVTYGGILYSFLIKSPLEYSLQFQFDFRECGIELLTAMTYSPVKNLLLLAVCGESAVSSSKATIEAGVQAWRLVDSKPFVSRSVVSGGLGQGHASRDMLHTVRRIRLFAGASAAQVEKSIITGMSLNPNGQVLATIDCGGMLQLRDVPSLQVTRTYSCRQQFPDEQKKVPSFASSASRRKSSNASLGIFSDLSWWSNEAVVLASDRGHVVVGSYQNPDRLHNRLGAPELLEPFPSVASVGESGGFYALECDRQWVLPAVHRQGDSLDSVDSYLSREDSTDGADSPSPGQRSDDDDDDEDDEEDMPLVRRLSRRSTIATKQVLYFFTENDRFRTEAKTQKVLQCSYRLYSLQLRTPEELFYRRIQGEEYGEALSLADRYNLDKDIVYQSQWHSKPASPHTIQDYMSKISKHDWVLGECLNRIPSHFDTLMELLKYGLMRASSSTILNLSSLTAIDQSDWSSDFDSVVEHDEFGNPIMLSASERHQMAEKRYDEKARKFKLSVLTEEQQLMVRCRVKLLQYQDRLITYESIMGADKVDDKYSPEFFRSFRDANLVESAINFAQQAEWTSVDALLLRHGNTLLPHRLAILSSFPETMDPKEYRYLLPELGKDGKSVIDFETEELRGTDWSEDVLGSHGNSDDGQFVYDKSPWLSAFRGDLTVAKVTGWYRQRAIQVESLSGLVENSLKLVSLALDRNVNKLDALHSDLQTLETLVYECDCNISLKALLAMPLSEHLELILSRAQADDSAAFVRDVRCWAVPLLRSAERRGSASGSDLLGEYLVKKAKDDLRLPLAVFENSIGGKPIISEKSDLIRIALNCVYACESEDQLSLADAIIRCLPSSKSSVGKEIQRLQKEVDRLEEHLMAAELVGGYGVGVSVRAIRDVQDDTSEAERMLTKLARHVARRSALDYSQFRALLADMVKLREDVFKSVSEATVYQILAGALLTSGNRDNLQLADSLISSSDQPVISTIKPVSATTPTSSLAGTARRTPQAGPTDSIARRSSGFQALTYRVPFDSSVNLVITAAREYFNSAASLADNDMCLARECLSLIKVESEAVQTELNLISAIGLLSEFDVAILPLQVRLSDDRLSLVKACVLSQSTSYKKSDQLLELASALTFSACDSSSELSSDLAGVVLMWIAEQAVKVEDLSFASQTLGKLMEIGHAPAWKLCRTLGLNESTSDLSFRRQLLSFAITHCPADSIEQLLQSIHLLEAKLLYMEVAGQTTSYGQSAMNMMQSVGGGAMGAMQSVGGGAFGAVSSVGGGAMGAMQSVGGGALGAMTSVGGGAIGAVQSVGGGALGAMGSVIDSSSVSRAVVDSAGSAVSQFMSLGAGAMTKMVAVATSSGDSGGAATVSSGGGSNNDDEAKSDDSDSDFYDDATDNSAVLVCENTSESLVGKSAGDMLELCQGWMQSATSYWSSSQQQSTGSDMTSLLGGMTSSGSTSRDAERTLAVRCHPFYADLFPPNASYESSFTYSELSPANVTTGDRQFSVNQSLLRTCKITAECNQTSVDQDEMTRVLLRLAEDSLYRDTSLALSYLLALPKVESANAVFDGLPPCLLSYQLAIYYYSLHIYVLATMQLQASPTSSGDDISQKASNPAAATMGKAGKKGSSKSGKRSSTTVTTAAGSNQGSLSSSESSPLGHPYDGPPAEMIQWVFRRHERGCVASAAVSSCEVSSQQASSVATVGGGDTDGDSRSTEAALKSLSHHLQVYRDRLADFVQAGVLRQLDEGIDDMRFTTDSAYKVDVILSLSRCLDSVSLETALALSQRYKLGTWSVYMEHVIFLFNESQLSWSDIQERCNSRSAVGEDSSAASAASGKGKCKSVVDHLLEEPQRFADRLHVDVFSKLDGGDHSRFLLYYDMMQAAVSAGAQDETPISAQQHSKLLKKLKAAAPSLDYKQLVYGSSPLDAIKPVVIASNVHVIAKIVARVPVADGMLTSSRVFGTFCEKLFWDGDGKKKPTDSKDWIHRYEATQEYTAKLTPHDFLLFCRMLTYSIESYQRVSLDSRLEICRRCAKQCRQLASQPAQPKRRQSSLTSAAVDEALAAASEMTFDEVSQELQIFLSHLESLQSDIARQLTDMDAKHSTDFHCRYALSACEKDPVIALCGSLLADGRDVLLADGFLTMTEKIRSHGVRLSQLVDNLVSETLEKIRMDDGKTESSLVCLSRVLTSVSHYLEAGGKSVKSSGVVERLRTFCAEPDLEMTSRLAVLRLLKQSFHLSQEDEALLLFCNTTAIVGQFWKKTLEDDAVADDMARQALFTELLGDSGDKMPCLTALAELLCVWPPLRDSSGSNAWCRLFCRLVTAGGSDGLASVLKHRAALSSDMLISDDKSVVDELLSSKHVVVAIKFCIISGHKELRDTAIDLLRGNEKLDIAQDDTSLSELLIANDLSPAVTSTPYFATFTSHVQELSEKSSRQDSASEDEVDQATSPDSDEQSGPNVSVDSIAEEMCNADMPAEAGSMLMTARGTASGLTTFDASMSFVSRWWNSST